MIEVNGKIFSLKILLKEFRPCVCINSVDKINVDKVCRPSMCLSLKMVCWTHLSVRKHLLQGEGQQVFVLDYLTSNRRTWKVSCEKQYHIRSKAATVKTGNAESIKEQGRLSASCRWNK